MLFDRIAEFVNDFGLEKEYVDKARLLLEQFKIKNPASPYEECEIAPSLLWALLFINGIFTETPDATDVATFFQIEEDRLGKITEEILREVDFFDKKFFTANTLKALDELFPARRKLVAQNADNLPEVLGELFDNALSYYESGEIEIAIAGFYSIIDFLDRERSAFTADDYLGFYCASISCLGNIFWDIEDMKTAKKVFSQGIAQIECELGALTKLDLDIGNENHQSILYLIDDYASLHYIFDDRKAAQDYFEIIKRIDTENSLESQIAIDFIKQGKTWQEYSDYLDSIQDES